MSATDTRKMRVPPQPGSMVQLVAGSALERARMAVGGYPSFQRVSAPWPTWAWRGFIVEQLPQAWCLSAPGRDPILSDSESEVWQYAYTSVALHYESELAGSDRVAQRSEITVS